MEKHDEANPIWAPWMAFDVTRAIAGKTAPNAEAMAQAAHLPLQAMFQQGGAAQKICSQVSGEMAAYLSRRTQAWSEVAGNACQCRNAQEAVAAMSSFWTQAFKDQFETAQRIQAACVNALQSRPADEPGIAKAASVGKRDLH